MDLGATSPLLCYQVVLFLSSRTGESVCVQVRLVREAAEKTTGFSGRELAKLMASVQAAVYGTSEARLTDSMFRMVLDLKLKQHSMRIKMEASRQKALE